MATKTRPTVLKTSVILLQCVSAWPLYNKSKFYNFLHQVFLYASSANLAVATVFLFLKAVETQDLVNRSEAIDIITLTSSAMYKLLFFYHHNEELSHLASCADKMHFPNGWMRWAPPLAIFHSLSSIVVLSFWGMCPLLKVWLESTPLNDLTLPINIYVWGYLNTPEFTVIYVLGTLSLVTSAYVYMSIDGFFFTSIHAANGALQDLELKVINLRNEESTDERRYKKLKEYIVAHSFIITFLTNLDKIFRSLIVADVLHAIISLSFAMFQMSESKGPVEWSKTVIFVFYCFFHQYLNSYFGQGLINRQEALRIALLDLPWEDDKKIGVAAVMMMTVGYRIKRLSAWKMYFLQYETFVDFTRSMISTYMLLRQVQDKI